LLELHLKRAGLAAAIAVAAIGAKILLLQGAANGFCLFVTPYEVKGPCLFQANLRTATVEEGVARLVVVPVDVSDDETSCGQCIADASFEITGTFAGRLPDELFS
jgi:hypothetical protein